MFSSNVVATELPADSALYDLKAPDDFLDCYRAKSSTPVRQAAEIIAKFPPWAGFLVKIRNIVVAPFGLAKGGADVADKVGFFPVEQETETELIAGFDDKHLDFRLSVLQLDGHIFLSTWVHPHHWAGWLYLWMILPFHILIVRNALTRVQSQSDPA